MQIITLLLIYVAFLCSCNSRGHVPSYILTDSPESKEEIYKYNHVENEKPLDELEKDF